MLNNANMKQISFIIFTSFLFFNIACNKPDNVQAPTDVWQKLNTPYLGEPLDIKFTSADTGYILGVEVNHVNDSIYNILIKTFDGGQTWKSIAYTNHKFLTDTSGGVMQNMYVSPFNSSILFSGNQNLLRSTDYGQHWQKVDTLNKKGTTNMYFFDPANGLSSTGYAISKTTDSGLNWTPFFYHQSLIGFHLLPFTSRQVGYFAGGFQIDGSAGGVMGKTTDGGKTWNMIDYPFDDISSVSFVNDNVGYVSMLTASGNIAVTYLGSKLIKTTNGGNNWQVIQQNPNDNKGTGYYNLFFKSEQEGYCTNHGIFHTLDGGKTWQKESNIPVSLLCFPDIYSSYAVDTSGAVFKSVF